MNQRVHPGVRPPELSRAVLPQRAALSCVIPHPTPPAPHPTLARCHAKKRRKITAAQWGARSRNWGFPAWSSGPRNEPPAARSAQVPLAFPEPFRRSSLCPLFMPCRGRLGWRLRGLRLTLGAEPPPHTYRTLRGASAPRPFSPFPLFLPKGVWGLCSALLPSSGWALIWRVRSGPAPQTPDRESTVPTSVPGRHAKRGPKPTYFILAPQRGKIFYFF